MEHRLKQYLEDSGRSVGGFAKALGVSPRTVANWMRDPGSVRMRDVQRIERETAGIVRREHWRASE